MRTQQTHTPPLEETRNYTTHHETTDTNGRDRRLRSVNPASCNVVGEVEKTPASKAAEILERAREVQRAWRRRPLDHRIRRARTLFYELLQWREELQELIADETGKSSLEARRELWASWQEVRNMLDEAEQRIGDRDWSRWWPSRRRTKSLWKPRGVVLVIASGWDPVQTTVAPGLAATIAGNAVIVVGDHNAPLSSQSTVNIASATGIPDQLWTGVAGDEALVDRLADGADAIVCYGSQKQTRRLAQRQAGRMIPVVGRWNTQDVMVVLADADIKQAAVAAVRGSCSQAGQTRRTLRRIYVQNSVADRFVDAVVEEIGALRQADRGDQQGMEVGPLSSSDQLETIEELVDEASRKGARLVAGGRARPRCRGFYFEPTVLTGVDESMRLWKEGAPGPVVAIAPVEAPADAVQRTKSTNGHGAVSIFTTSRDVAQNLAGSVDATTVGINEVVRRIPPGAESVRGTVHGPIDPVGADRLEVLSQRILMVDRGGGTVSSVLRPDDPRRIEQMLDAALTMVHRRGWLRAAVGSLFER